MNNDMLRRVRFCLFAAALNFLALILPRTEGVVLYSGVMFGVLLNLSAVWLILRGVKPLRDEPGHLKAITYSKRWIALLAVVSTLALFAAAIGGAIERQAVPFLVFGYAFFLLLPAKIMDLAVERRMREIGEDG